MNLIILILGVLITLTGYLTIDLLRFHYLFILFGGVLIGVAVANVIVRDFKRW